MRGVLGVLILFLPLVWGQGVERPSLGFEWDSQARVVRPIQGVLGASLLGDAIQVPLTETAVGPQFAIGNLEGAGASLLDLRTGESKKLPEIEGAAQSFLVSAGGSGAIAIQDGLARFYRNVDKAPALVWTLAVPDGARLAAVSDDGSTAIGAMPDSIWIWTQSNSTQIASGELKAAAFELATRKGFFAVGGEIFSVDAGLQVSLIGRVDGVSSLAIGKGNKVVALDLAGRKLHFVIEGFSLDLPVEQGSFRTIGEDLVQVSMGATSPVWLLDLKNARLMFVPKSEAASE